MRTHVFMIGYFLFVLSTQAQAAPKQEKAAPKNRIRHGDVRKLLSAFRSTRQQAKAQICQSWPKMGSKEKKEMASEISKIASSSEMHRYRPDSVRDAMSLLGQLRSLEGIDVLATYIGFPVVHHPDAGDYVTPNVGMWRPGIRVERQFPAVQALLEIGDACADAVISKLTSTDNAIEHELCIHVLRRLQHAGVRRKLEQAIPKTLSRRRIALRRAIQAIDETNAAKKPN